MHSGPHDVPYVIREARWSDCGAMARKLCLGQKWSYALAGLEPKQRLRQLWGASLVRRACLIDGRIVAMWGLTGSILSPSATVWLVASEEAAKHRHAFLREVRAQLVEFSAMKRMIRGTVLAHDEASLRFAKFIGLETGDPMKVEDTEIYIVPTVFGRA